MQTGTPSRLVVLAAGAMTSLAGALPATPAQAGSPEVTVVISRPGTGQHVAYGGSVRVEGTVRDAQTGSPVAGERILLQLCDGDVVCKRERFIVTDADGRFGTDYGNVTLDWVSMAAYDHPELRCRPNPPTDSCEGARGVAWVHLDTSAQRQAPVRVGATPPRELVVGSPEAVPGSVWPNRAGEYVRLQRWVSGSWRPVTGAYVRESGRFTLFASPPTAGSHSYRVVKASSPTSYAAVSTPFVTVAH